MRLRRWLGSGGTSSPSSIRCFETLSFFKSFVNPCATLKILDLWTVTGSVDDSYTMRMSSGWNRFEEA